MRNLHFYSRRISPFAAQHTKNSIINRQFNYKRGGGEGEGFPLLLLPPSFLQPLQKHYFHLERFSRYTTPKQQQQQQQPPSSQPKKPLKKLPKNIYIYIIKNPFLPDKIIINMLQIYLPRFFTFLFTCYYLIALAHASPVAYSDKNLVEIDRLRASGASEVFYFFFSSLPQSFSFKLFNYPPPSVFFSFLFFFGAVPQSIP